MPSIVYWLSGGATIGSVGLVSPFSLSKSRLSKSKGIPMFSSRVNGGGGGGNDLHHSKVVKKF